MVVINKFSSKRVERKFSPQKNDKLALKRLGNLNYQIGRFLENNEIWCYNGMACIGMKMSCANNMESMNKIQNEVKGINIILGRCWVP